MHYDKIEVQAYAGYRGEEGPRTFVVNDKSIEVLRVLRQWVEETVTQREKMRCFKVKGSDWRIHVLCYDEGNMTWLYRYG